MTLTQIDEPFLVAFKEQADAMKRGFNSMAAREFPPLDGIEVTEAVLRRMKFYTAAQNQTKQLLNKRYATPAADFFVETVLFYLSLYCHAINPNLDVHSERQIRPKRGQLRPDISIWHGDEVTAIVECKTQLGWNRKNWERDFKERERRLKAEFPRARAFLLVLSEGNWEGFSNKGKTANQYFVLLKKGVEVAELAEENIRGNIVNRIEELFSRIK